jgi:oligopeptide/dipeptide ABC transporter ATP-binding protein
LLAAIPRPQPGERTGRVVLGGDVPSPANPPSGCRFHTRCPHVQPLCKEQSPALETRCPRPCHRLPFLADHRRRRAGAAPVAMPPARRRLERLQAAFLAGAPAAPI